MSSDYYAKKLLGPGRAGYVTSLLFGRTRILVGDDQERFVDDAF